MLSNSKIDFKKFAREKSKKIPGLRMFIKKLRIIFDKLFAEKDKMTLPILLNSSCPFHKDFKILYDLITKNR